MIPGLQITLPDDEWVLLKMLRVTEHGSKKYIVFSEYGRKYLHVEIAKRMGLDTSQQIDHIDGSYLNNRRDNLRSANSYQQQWNRKIRARNNTSGYKGVSYDKRNGKYVAAIYFKSERIYLGSYLTAKEAAEMYDLYASDLFGEFARLNFPGDF
jgi:hypothetical protein